MAAVKLSLGSKGMEDVRLLLLAGLMASQESKK